MDDLRDPGCRVHVVTLLEELPVTEAIETVQAIRDLGLTPGILIANRCLEEVDVPDPVPPAPDAIGAEQWEAMTDALIAEAESARGQTAWRALLEYRTGLDVRRLPELEPGSVAASARPAVLAAELAAL